jgi:hypothetical protein
MGAFAEQGRGGEEGSSADLTKQKQDYAGQVGWLEESDPAGCHTVYGLSRLP